VSGSWDSKKLPDTPLQTDSKRRPIGAEQTLPLQFLLSLVEIPATVLMVVFVLLFYMGGFTVGGWILSAIGFS
jgi:hypothetical protein